MQSVYFKLTNLFRIKNKTHVLKFNTPSIYISPNSSIVEGCLLSFWVIFGKNILWRKLKSNLLYFWVEMGNIILAVTVIFLQYRYIECRALILVRAICCIYYYFEFANNDKLLYDSKPISIYDVIFRCLHIKVWYIFLIYTLKMYFEMIAYCNEYTTCVTLQY